VHLKWDTVQKYARAVYTPTYTRIGWMLPHDHNGRALQATVLRDACRYAAGDCVSQALARFTRWLNNDMVDRLPPDTFETIVCTGVAHSNASVWQRIMARFDHTTVATERTMLFDALSCTRDVGLLRRCVQACTISEWCERRLMSDALDRLSPNYVSLSFTLVASNVHAGGAELAWPFAKQHWAKINETCVVYFAKVDAIAVAGLVQPH
jgi:aminopeptidase N